MKDVPKNPFGNDDDNDNDNNNSVSTSGLKSNRSRPPQALSIDVPPEAINVKQQLVPNPKKIKNLSSLKDVITNTNKTKKSKNPFSEDYEEESKQPYVSSSSRSNLQPDIPPPPPPPPVQQSSINKKPSPASIIDSGYNNNNNREQPKVTSKNPFRVDEDKVSPYTYRPPRGGSGGVSFVKAEGLNERIEQKRMSINRGPLGQQKQSERDKSLRDSDDTELSSRGSSSHVDAYVELSEHGEESEANLIYHKNRLSTLWLVTALVIHIGQFAALLVLGRELIPFPVLIVLVILTLSVIILLVASRCLVRKNSNRGGMSLFNKKIERDQTRTPDDEADYVPPSAVYCLCIAAVLEGCCFAIFTAVVAGHSTDIIDDEELTRNNTTTIVEILQFASITLLAFHRILRPANRVDPMRTVLELEVICVCWDCLDGATFFILISQQRLSFAYDIASRVIMVFWYFSVGFRMSVMMFSHLPPTDFLYSKFLCLPMHFSKQPTVDRSLQSLRLRALVTVVMGVAELYAGALRVSLWAQGLLRNNPLQQEMALKNILFLTSIYSAYSMWTLSETREWNNPILPFGFRVPSRDSQLVLYRWLFVLSYVLQGALFSSLLIRVTKETDFWAINTACDVILAFIFAVYFRNLHRQKNDAVHRCFLFPQQSYVVFPARKVFIMSIIMACSMYLARIPGVYYTYSILASRGEIITSGWYIYDNVLLIVIMSILPIAFGAMYWSVSFMLFRREFTASPNNYNAIHDPIISMVATATMIEGSIDVLSCATFMQLAIENLPAGVNGAVVLFSLLELANACQSFAFQVILSGGHDDTPSDLVKWKAYLRMARGIIDFGALALRIVLWVRYGLVSSVFLIKNLYNLLHTVAQIERHIGVWRYPKKTLFTEFVPPQDWYNMNKQEWKAISNNNPLDAPRSGRRV